MPCLFALASGHSRERHRFAVVLPRSVLFNRADVGPLVPAPVRKISFTEIADYWLLTSYDPTTGQYSGGRRRPALATARAREPGTGRLAGEQRHERHGGPRAIVRGAAR